MPWRLMAKYLFVVFTEPAAGQEDKYNAWYTEQHLRDVVAVPGFRSAQRYRLKFVRTGNFAHRYLALYEFDADNPDEVLREMGSRVGTSAMMISPALDRSRNVAGLFEACSPPVTAK